MPTSSAALKNKITGIMIFDKKVVTYIIISVMVSLYLVSCKKFVTIDPPVTEPATPAVFSNDTLALQVAAGVYRNLSGSFASGGVASITYQAGLSSDELIIRSKNDFYYNALLPTTQANVDLWFGIYQEIFLANNLIKQLNESNGVTPALKIQLSAEASFIRAFCYFYLVNLFGDVPLVLTTDPVKNSNIPRSPTDVVYSQIISDLRNAQALLPADYSIFKNQRVRANKSVATALLARVYLYRHNWIDAEIEANKLISDTSLFSLSPLKDVFLKNNKEAIWQLYKGDGNTEDAATFAISLWKPENATLRPDLVKSFEENDKRRYEWITSTTFGGITYYYPLKYKERAKEPITEYSTVLRLAEQYLIRAEARAWLGRITGVNSAATDLNVIRKRAGLDNTLAGTKEEMLSAIETERLHEFFSEWGHRWLDLKRSPGLTAPGYTRADDILKGLKDDWKSTDILYPIPRVQIDNDPAMHDAQNPGY